MWILVIIATSKQAQRNTSTAFWKSKLIIRVRVSLLPPIFQSAGPILMPYSNIRSRAGLVALVFALIISLVSAAPVPATASGLSSTLSPRSDPSQSDGSEINFSGRMSTLPFATRLTLQQDISNTMVDDGQLVRRSLASRTKAIFHKAKVGLEKIGHGIAHAAKTVAKAVKHEAIMVGKTIVKGVKKAVNFVKTTGAKIVKFGLEVYSTATHLVGKALHALPGIGQSIGKVLDGASAAADAIQKHIKVHLSNKLEKGMKIMEKIKEYTSLPGKAGKIL